MAAAAVRIALAILLDAAALVIWDIGTRSPPQLIADVAAGLRRPASIIRGGVRFAIGGAALAAAAFLAASAATRPADFSIVESLGLGAALGVEALIGADLRRRRS